MPLSGTSQPPAVRLTSPEALPEGDDQRLGGQTNQGALRDPALGAGVWVADTLAAGGSDGSGDPIGAGVWVAELPEGPQKTVVLSTIAVAWAEREPQTAAYLIKALELPDMEAMNKAAISVVSAWAMTDPSAAARWVETFPVGQIREYAMENVAFQWMQSDPAAFMAWVQRLPETADRDSAINAGVGTLVESEPDMAVRWSEAIGNEGTRRYQMERAVRRWLKADRVAARIWISGSSLADEAKQRLLAQVLPEADH